MAKRFRTALAVAATGAVATGVLLTADTGMSAPKTSTAGNSLTLVVKSGPDLIPNWSETVTFNVTSTVYKKWVDLYCYQNGVYVYSQTAGFFAEYPWAQNYTLASAYWTAGGANCTATLYTATTKGHRTNLATLNFTVYP